jgi:hypothetical protein
MSKLKRVVLIAGIVAIAVGAWQAYSYIERSTRPEPAVVYTVGNAPYYVAFDRLEKATNGKIKLDLDFQKIVCSNENGSRRWILQRTSGGFEGDVFRPWYYVKSEGKGVALAFNQKDLGLGARLKLPLYQIDLKGRGAKQLSIKATAGLMPFTNFGEPARCYYFDLFSPSHHSMYVWEGLERGFMPVLEQDLNRWKQDYLTIEDGYCYQNTVLLCGSKLFWNPDQNERVFTSDLIWLDAVSGEVVAHWVMPTTGDKPDFGLIRADQYQPDWTSRYKLKGKPVLVRPRIGDRPAALLLGFTIVDREGAEKIDSEKTIYRVFEFDPIEGIGRSLDIAIPGVTEKQQLVDTDMTRLEVLFYDQKRDITYVNIGLSVLDTVTYGLKSDYSWTGPLPIHCDRMMSRLARDGSIWSAELVATLDTPFEQVASQGMKLWRYDPDTGHAETIARGTAVTLNLVVD